MEKEACDILINDIAAVYGAAEVLDALADWCSEEQEQADCKSKGTRDWERQARILRQAAQRIKKLSAFG